MKGGEGALKANLDYECPITVNYTLAWSGAHFCLKTSAENVDEVNSACGGFTSASLMFFCAVFQEIYPAYGRAATVGRTA